MSRNISVYGKTTPYEINLMSYDSPFAIGEYLMVNDKYNNNPLCRVISSIVDEQDGTMVFKATAKVESTVLYPIDVSGDVVTPTFKSIAPFVMSTIPKDGFILGEILGTAFNDIPQEYTELVAMYDRGKVVSQTAIPFVFNHKKLFESPHIGLFGGSGSGKTVAMKVIIEELMKRDYPGVLFDPHLEMNFAENKPEIPHQYRVDFSHKFNIFNIGKDGFGINFAELSTDELISIMSFSGELSGAMDSLLRTLHHKGMTLYELRKLIDDLSMLCTKLYQTSEDLTADEERLSRLYISKIPSPNTVIALSWRLNSLEQTNIFNGTTLSLVRAIQDRKICVLRGTNEQIHIVASHLLEKLYLLRRMFIDAREAGYVGDIEPFPPFFIGMDEAHLFCPNNSEFSLTKRIMKTIAQEGRKYGVFELLATQRPALLDPTIVAQISNKFIFRLSIKEDIDSIKKETDLNEGELKKLPYMNSGECFVSSSIIGRTLAVKIRYGITMAKNSKNPFDEFSDLPSLTPIEEAVLKCVPFTTDTAVNVLLSIKDSTGAILKLADLLKIGDDLASRGLIKIERTFCGTSFIKK